MYEKRWLFKYQTFIKSWSPDWTYWMVTVFSFQWRDSKNQQKRESVKLWFSSSLTMKRSTVKKQTRLFEISTEMKIIGPLYFLSINLLAASLKRWTLAVYRWTSANWRLSLKSEQLEMVPTTYKHCILNLSWADTCLKRIGFLVERPCLLTGRFDWIDFSGSCWEGFWTPLLCAVITSIFLSKFMWRRGVMVYQRLPLKERDELNIPKISTPYDCKNVIDWIRKRAPSSGAMMNRWTM